MLYMLVAFTIGLTKVARIEETGRIT
jgi:hypothetical protein